MLWDGDCIRDLDVRVVVCPGVGGDQHSARFAALVYRVQGLGGQWRQGQLMSTRTLVLPFCTPSSSGRVFCFSIKFGGVTSLACIQGWRLRGEVVAKCPARSKRPFWKVWKRHAFFCASLAGTEQEVQSYHIACIFYWLFFFLQTVLWNMSVLADIVRMERKVWKELIDFQL